MFTTSTCIEGVAKTSDGYVGQELSIKAGQLTRTSMAGLSAVPRWET